MRCTIQTYRPQLVDGSSGAAIGACCTGTNCFIAHESSCQSVLGTWQGPATSCEDFICNETNAIGACCSGSNCADLLTLSECNAAGGVWQGELTTCGGVSCSGTNPTGACCQNTTCTNGWSASDCAAAGGAPLEVALQVGAHHFSGHTRVGEPGVWKLLEFDINWQCK